MASFHIKSLTFGPFLYEKEQKSFRLLGASPALTPTSGCAPGAWTPLGARLGSRAGHGPPPTLAMANPGMDLPLLAVRTILCPCMGRTRTRCRSADRSRAVWPYSRADRVEDHSCTVSLCRPTPLEMFSGSCSSHVAANGSRWNRTTWAWAEERHGGSLGGLRP